MTRKDCMNIHFSNVNFSSNSGPNTFASRLANSLTRMGHSIVDENEKYDVFLAFIEPASTPSPGAKIVQRLDGIWFKPEQFLSHNKNIKALYDNADAVIWQSNFDKKMTEFHWGYKQGQVIHNGAPLERKKVSNETILSIRGTYEKIFVCSANWHRQKRLKENVELFLKIKEEYPKSCLIIMGSNPDYFVRHKDILYTGSISHDLCLEMFSAADWMIHLAWLDHCPNVVIESLSQGCPVICTDSGGTSEIVQKNGVVIPESIPYNYELTDYDKPYEIKLEAVNLPGIEIENSYIDIQKVAQKYIKILSGDNE
mgnify:CR=1 FL=1|tara:strand:+ start:15117 stop:16052 length:936 start_codon:yes stop_codon:yes gene_type:complete